MMKRILDFRFSILDYTSSVNPKSKIQNPKLLMLTGLFYFVSSGIAWACPFCKDALFDVSQARQGLQTAQGYAWSIGLLLGVPIGLIGGVATLIMRAQRRRRRGGLP